VKYEKRLGGFGIFLS